jgi:hypothetical protein
VTLASRPNFVSLLAEALQRPVVDARTRKAVGASPATVPEGEAGVGYCEGVLEALGATLQLPQPVQVALGLSLAFVSTTSIATTAFRFVRSRVGLFSGRSPSHDCLPFAVFHPLLFLLRTHPASLAAPKETNELISRLHSAHSSAVAAVPALPVIQGPVALVDTLVQPAQGAALQKASTRTDASILSLRWNASEDVAGALAVAQGVALVGPSSADLDLDDPAITSLPDAADRAAARIMRSTLPGPYSAGRLGPIATLADDVTGVVLDLGPACSQSPEAFRAALATVGRGPASGALGKDLVTLSDSETACLLVGIANSQHPSSTSARGAASKALPAAIVSSFLAATNPTSRGADAAAAALSSGNTHEWNMDTVCAVLRSDHPSLDWRRVARALDQPGERDGDLSPPGTVGSASMTGPLQSADAFSFVVTAINKCSGHPFPSGVLLERWRNAHAQLAAVRFAVAAPPSLLSFARVSDLMEPVAGSAHGCGTANQAWCAVGLYTSLMRLAHAGGLQPLCLELLRSGQAVAPELVLLGIAHAKARGGETHSGEDSHVLRGRVYEAVLSSILGKALSVQADPADLCNVERAILRGTTSGALASLAPSDLQLEVLRRLVAVSPPLAFNSVVHVAVLVSQAFDRRQAAAVAEANKTRSQAAIDEVVIGSIDDSMRALLVYVTRGVGLLKTVGATPRAILGNLHTVSALIITSIGVLTTWATDADPTAGPSAVQEALSTVLSQPGENGAIAVKTLANVVDRFVRASSPARADQPAVEPPIQADVFLKFFRCLQEASSGLGPSVVSSIRATFDAACAVIPSLVSSTVSDEIEKADRFLQSVFSGATQVPEAIKELNAMHSSPPGGAARAREPARVLHCIVSNLFNEQTHFPKYPPRELRITAELMAGMLSSHLVEQDQVQASLRTVASALSRPLDTPEAVSMAKFSVWLLAASLPFFAAWPEFVDGVLKSPVLEFPAPVTEALRTRLRVAISPAMEALSIAARHGGDEFKPPRGAKFLSAIDRGAASVKPMVGAELDALAAAIDAAASGGKLGQRTGEAASSARPVKHPSPVLTPATPPMEPVKASQPQTPMAPAPPPSFASKVAEFVASLTNGSYLSQAVDDEDEALAEAPDSAKRERLMRHMRAVLTALIEGNPPPPASEEDELDTDGDAADPISRALSSSSISPDAPSDAVMPSVVPPKRDLRPPVGPIQDKARFILNNFDEGNVEARAHEIGAIARSSVDTRRWLADYIVSMRARKEPNLHGLLLRVLEVIDSEDFVEDMRNSAIDNAKILLLSPKIKTSGLERAHLKNIGALLGKLTLAMGRPLLAREIDLKALILEAYESGRLIAIVGFVAKVLQAAGTTTVFSLPNPWTTSMLRVLRELYEVPDIKLNIKFEVELLAKELGTRIVSVHRTDLLRSRRRPDLTSNPDFAATAASNTSAIPGRDSSAMHGSGREAMPAPDPLADDARMAVIPALARLVAVPRGMVLEQTVSRSSMRFAAVVAVDSAVREVLRAVADRSATIAAVTTHHLVSKDFALDGSHHRMSAAATLMASHLAGALAQVGAQDLLRPALANSLKEALSRARGADGADPAAAAQALRAIAEENLPLGCALIEKAAMDKASTDALNSLGPQLRGRASGTLERSALGPTESKAIESLPAELRTGPKAPTAVQLAVYRSFSRSIAPAAPPRAPGSASTPSVAAEPVEAESFSESSALRPANSTPSGGEQKLLDANTAFNTVRSLLQQLVRSARAAASEHKTGLDALPDGHAVFAALRQLAQFPNHIDAKIRPALIVEVCRVVFGVLAELASTSVLRQSLLAALLILQEHLMAYTGKSMPSEVANWLSRLNAQTARSVPLLAALVAGRLVDVAQLDAAVAAGAKEPATAGSPPQLSGGTKFAAALIHRVVVAEGLAPPKDFHQSLDALTAAVSMAGGEDRPEAAVLAAVRSITSGSAPSPALLALAASADPSYTPHERISGRAIMVAAAISAEAASLPRPPFPPSTSAAPPSDAQDASAPASTAASAAAPPTAPPRLPMPRVGAPLDEPQEVQTTVFQLLEKWVQLWFAVTSGRVVDRVFADYMKLLRDNAMLSSDENLDRFFRVSLTLCVQNSVLGAKAVPADAAAETKAIGSPPTRLHYTAIDALSKLVVLLLKASATPADKLKTLGKLLDVIGRTILRDAEANSRVGGTFDQRPYLRLLANLFQDTILPRADAEASAASTRFQLHVLTAYTNLLHTLRPMRVPSFALAWQALVSHRALVSRIIALPAHSGWPLLLRGVVDQLRFLDAIYRGGLAPVAVHVVYKGVLRSLLSIVHDMPEFLADNCHTVCEVMPASCLQLRNLVLSAFPNRMRLPDPFTPALKVDKLPAMTAPPRIVGDPADRLPPAFRRSLVDFLSGSISLEAFVPEAVETLSSTEEEEDLTGSRYSWQRISALVLTVCIRTLGGGPASPTTVSASPGFQLLHALLPTLDADGRFLALNAIANQLRYPNSHTHWFSLVTLMLFDQSPHEVVKEQLSRVLLERLLVNRPHPWGLLITFIELIKQPHYRFWEQPFTRKSPEIFSLFKRVAKSCGVEPPDQ